jgi:hypothetical protein
MFRQSNVSFELLKWKRNSGAGCYRRSDGTRTKWPVLLSAFDFQADTAADDG